MPNLGELAVGHTVNLIKWMPSGKYDILWFPLVGKAPLDRARNECHQAFLQSRYDYLFFLDADTVPPVEALDMLLMADVDMVSATVQTFKMHNGEPRLDPVAYRWNEEDPEDIGYKVYVGSGVDEVDVATLACTLIRRPVLEKVKIPAFQYQCLDKFGIDGYSEDFFFSRCVKEAGFKIHNHYGILCHHFKKFDCAVVNTLMINASLAGKP